MDGNQRITVAAVQIAPERTDVEQNIERLEDRIRQAAATGATLIVCPEVTLSGYLLSPEQMEQVAQPFPGSASARMSALAVELQVELIYGFLEREGGQYYNAAALCRRDGVAHRYRKVHLPQLGLDQYCEPGDGPLEPIATPSGSVGILLCYDLRFPEAARALALRDADILVLPTSWPQVATDYPEFLTRARASENRLLLIAADRVGSEGDAPYLGRSQIVQQDGTILVEAGSDEETILYATVTLRDMAYAHVASIRNARTGLLHDRRPAMYRALTEESEVWTS